MSWSFRIGRIAGTDVKVHVTFLMLLAWIALSSRADGGTSAAIGSVLAMLALFGCVLLHEFGHIFAAKHYGIHTPDVILLPIGGVARLSRIPEEPKQEILIALAGPAVNLVIVAAICAGLALSGNAPWQSIRHPFAAIDGPPLVSLMALNLLLLVFNLAPAFPMDGGRVLRALIAMRLPYVRATRAAARVGQMLAMVGGMYGFLHQPMDISLMLVAAFVFLAAGAEAAAVETRAAGRGVTVSQMMVTDFRTLRVYATIADAVALLLAGEQREFPVVDNLGHVEGMLTRDHLIQGLTHHGPQATVSEAMATGVPHVSPQLGFGEALSVLRASRLPALPVVDPAGALVGMLTMDNVTDLLLVRRAQEGVA
ncbi:MAG: site-2 protease family protein [Bacillota bacterium]|jgi:stage IV sporulation protein FB